MSNKKSIISMFIVVIMVFSLFPMIVHADVSSGTLANGVTWEYDSSTHTLTFDGNTGDDYIISGISHGEQPWYDVAVAGGGVQNYVFGTGIQRLGYKVMNQYGSESPWGMGAGSDGTCGNYTDVTVYVSENFDDDILNDVFGIVNSSGDTKGVNVVWLSIGADDGVSDVSAQFDLASQTLTVSGTGAIKDSASASYSPFNYNYIKNKVKHIIIEEGITRVGNYTFNGFRIVETVDLPSTLSTIGSYAFNSVGYLNETSHCIDMLTIPASVTEIGNYAFSSAGINNITNLSESNQTIGSQAFEFYSATGVTPNIFLYSANTNFESAVGARNWGAGPQNFIYLDSAQTSSGTLDNGVTWEYDPATHTLSFDGDGEIPDYDDGEQPWYSAAVAGGGVGNYSLGSGITGIGNGTFGYYGGSGAGWGYGGNYSGVGVSAPAGLSGSITSLAPGAGGGGGSGSGSDPEPVFGNEDYEVDEAGETGSTMIILDGAVTIFKASVPIKVSINQAADGTVTVPDTYTIDNLGPSGPIVVTNVSLVMKTGWSIAAYTDDFANKPADSSVLGLQMNGTNFATNGSYTMPSIVSSSILHSGSKILTFSAKLPAHKTPVENENIAAIVFTLDFDKAV